MFPDAALCSPPVIGHSNTLPPFFLKIFVNLIISSLSVVLISSHKCELEILGNGNQIKSYLHINDLVDAIIYLITNSNRRENIYNLGSEDQINVKEIAKIIINEMKLKNVN